MEKEKQILEEVDKTLRALDNVPSLKANPFLFTRIQAALASGADVQKKSIVNSLKLKPLALALLVVLNIISAVSMLRTDEGSSSRKTLISSLSEEYNPPQDDYVTGN